MKHWLLAGSAVALCAGSLSPACAQIAADSSLGGDIVVTARKRDERLIDVPIAISAFNEEQLARTGAKGLRDIAAMTPGLTFQDVNGAYAAPTIRGIAQIDQTSLQGNVGVFIDGVYLNNRTGIEFGFLDIERIEIAKGPQSALYGRNTFAGAINYVTAAPELNNLTGRASIELGDHGLRAYRGSVSVPMSETLAVRAFGGYGEFDGTIRNERSGKYLGGYDGNYAYGMSALFKPTDNLTLRAFGAYSKIDNRAVALYQPSTLQNNCGSTTVYNGTTYNTLYCGRVQVPEKVNVDDQVGYGTRGSNTLAYLNGEYDFGPVSLSATATYAKGKYSNLVDTSADPDAINRPVANGSAQTYIQSVTPRSTDKSLDIRLASNGENDITYSLGFYGYNSDLLNSTEGSRLPLGNWDGELIPYSATGGKLVSKGRSLYGTIGVKPLPELTFNAEVRWTHEKQDFKGTGSQAFTSDGRPIVGDQTFSFWTPRFTANYAFSRDVVAYASASKGMKTGGFNSNAFQSAIDYFRFGVETNWTYELGLKTSLMDGRLRLNADVYQIEWSGIQGQRSIPGSIISAVTNLGGARVKGIEGDVFFQVTPRFSISASGSYADPKYKDGYVDGDLAAPCGQYIGTLVTTVGCTNEVGGNQIARTSKYQYAIATAYEVPDLIGNTGGYIRFDYSYQSPKYTTGNELQSQGSIRLLNGRIGITHEGWEFSLFVKNMLDRKYVDRVTQSPSSNDGAPRTGITYIRVYPGERRTFGARLDYRF